MPDDCLDGWDVRDRDDAADAESFSRRRTRRHGHRARRAFTGQHISE
jgi:hypothetical protein